MSRKQSVIFLAAGMIVAGLMLVSCSSDSSPTGSSGTPPSPNSVNIQGMAFSPGSLTVAAGTKVTWTNKDSAPHTVTSTGSPSFTSSGTLSQNGTYSFTFVTAGTYTYICSIHPSMQGTIIVTP